MSAAENRVVVIGSGIAGNMAAAWLKKEQPDLEVVIVGRTDTKTPLVGESLTEFSSIFLRAVGMEESLRTRHFPKYGLSFYYKENIRDPASRRYAVHDPIKEPHIPSFLINRFTFDDDLRAVNRSRGIEMIEANVQDIVLQKDGPHELTLKDADGNITMMGARWIIDASGRRRFMARKLGLHKEPVKQRSTFWFRLADFDPEILRKIDAVRSVKSEIDSYYDAHHFIGSGNWIWCIPLQTAERRTLISIGITYRPDLVGKITSLEQFLHQVDSEHPVIGELVRSGTVVDTNAYLNYMYETPLLYSMDRWFMVGDSADTSDPLFSTGLVIVAIQATQAAEMIRRDRAGQLTESYVRDIERAYKAIRDTTQNEIATFYDVSHDPWQSHWRIHISVAIYFYFMLPQVLSGYMIDPVGAKWLWKIGEKERRKVLLLDELLKRASRAIGPQPSENVPNRYGTSVNRELTGPRDEDIPHYLSHLLRMLAGFRFRLLRQARWHQWWINLPVCASDLLLSLFLRIFFHGRSIKRSFVIRKFVGL